MSHWTPERRTMKTQPTPLTIDGSVWSIRGFSGRVLTRFSSTLPEYEEIALLRGPSENWTPRYGGRLRDVEPETWWYLAGGGPIIDREVIRHLVLLSDKQAALTEVFRQGAAILGTPEAAA